MLDRFAQCRDCAKRPCDLSDAIQFRLACTLEQRKIAEIISSYRQLSIVVSRLLMVSWGYFGTGIIEKINSPHTQLFLMVIWGLKPSSVGCTERIVATEYPNIPGNGTANVYT